MREYVADVKGMRVKGIHLNEGYLIVWEGQFEEENVEHQGTASRGYVKKNNKKRQVIDWSSREPEDCIACIEQLLKDLA